MAVAGNHQVGCDGCGRDTPLSEITAVSLPDGDAIACCSTCEPHIRSVAERLATLERTTVTCDGCNRGLEPTEGTEITLPDGASVTCCASCLEEAPGGSSTSTSESEPTGGICSQCRESVTGERNLITTIDGRTERLCHTCTADAEARGIVRSVAMATSRAREVLGVPADPTEEELRSAFLTQIKRAHPDRETGSESAFKLVKDAYDRLQ